MRRRAKTLFASIFSAPLLRRIGYHVQVMTRNIDRTFFIRLFIGLFCVVLIAAVIALILKALKIFRVSEEAEVGGIDIADHGETGYDFTPAGGSGGGGAFAMAGLNKSEPIDADGKADVSQKVAG